MGEVGLYKNYDGILPHPRLEDVIIALITAMHTDQAIEAMKANKHVLCEQRLSMSVEIVSFFSPLSNPAPPPCLPLSPPSSKVPIRNRRR